MDRSTRIYLCISEEKNPVEVALDDMAEMLWDRSLNGQGSMIHNPSILKFEEHEFEEGSHWCRICNYPIWCLDPNEKNKTCDEAVKETTEWDTKFDEVKVRCDQFNAINDRLNKAEDIKVDISINKNSLIEWIKDLFTLNIT